MRITLSNTALPIFLAVACGKAGSDIEQIHEKEGSDQSAVMSGWEIAPSSLESGHPLSNGLSREYEVVAPAGTRKFRLVFRRIRMEANYDFLIVQDQGGSELERITGSHSNYVSRTIQGDRAKIVVTTDSSVQSWGFAVNQLRHRGCAPSTPAAAPLYQARSCTELRSRINDLAASEVRRRFTEGHFGGPILLRSRAAEAVATPAPAHSETNVQVTGVDEADIVKTDGNFIYSISGRQLRIYRSWPADETQIVHSIDLEGWPREMFLEQNRVVVISGVQGDYFSPGPRPGPLVRMAPIWWMPDAFTKITAIDLSGAQPRISSETLLAGMYSNARRVGSSYRIILSRQLRWPQIQYWPDGNFDWNSKEWDQAMDQLEADAIRVVSNRAVADWLPQSYSIENGQRVALPIECGDFLLPEGSEELGFTAVATIDLSSGRPRVQETSAMVTSGEIYQSLDTLFLTANHQYACWEDAGTRGQFTHLHGFDVSQPARASYLASGGVEGQINDQFSLDEEQGFLRVATTTNKWQAPTPEEQSYSTVFVLEQSGHVFNVVGTTPRLAPGERIFGVRFLGSRGFVVTYRQVDPLFTLDLSDPRNPQVLAALKIPGFSTYLHPLDANHLFTIGQDFELDGTTRNGVALSIFDVNNLASPRLIHKSVVGTTSGYSEALHDHKAFTMYQQPGRSDFVLAIPFTDYGPPSNGNFWGTFVSSLKVFRVSPSGILGLGEITLQDLFAQNDQKDFGWYYMPNIRRGVFVDNYVYAISDAGLKVATIDDLSAIVASVAAAPQYENPTPVPTTISDSGTADVNIAIPDFNTTGISSVIDLAKDLEVQSLSVGLDIRHSYRGDLRVTIEHGGVVEILHDKLGGSAKDLIRTFSTERFRGMNAKGSWTLTVSDHARVDVGTLVSWSVDASGKDLSGGTTPAPVIQRTFSSAANLAIPDATSAGIRSTIDVPEGISIESLELQVSIAHTYRGDLRVTLEHGGTTYVAHDRAGGSAHDLRLTVSVDDFVGQDARGTWTLRVVDAARADVGTLETWQIDVSGRQLSRP